MTTSTRPKPKYASAEEVAATCSTDSEHISVRTVQRWCLEGVVVAVKTPGGGRWRILVDADGWPVDPRAENAA